MLKTMFPSQGIFSNALQSPGFNMSTLPITAVSVRSRDVAKSQFLKLLQVREDLLMAGTSGGVEETEPRDRDAAGISEQSQAPLTCAGECDVRK